MKQNTLESEYIRIQGIKYLDEAETQGHSIHMWAHITLKSPLFSTSLTVRTVFHTKQNTAAKFIILT